jgi:nitrite reductase (NADH) small subunit
MRTRARRSTSTSVWARRMPEARTRRRVAIPATALPRGTSLEISVDRRTIAVINHEDRLFAVFNRCPHQQAPLTLGRVSRAPAAGPVGELSYDPEVLVLRCPWHRYEFDLTSGRCLADPERLRVAVYDIRREGDEIAVYV